MEKLEPLPRRPGPTRAPLLAPDEARATNLFVDRVRREVPARLVQASLFGSKARREARPDSDVDVLLVFQRLPWDREPYATHAEKIAEQVARSSGIPVTTWSVSLVDLERGNRTPMLVDALEDSIPLWFARSPLPAVPFTPDDALQCVDALLTRVAEGGVEFAQRLAGGDMGGAIHRLRDDVVRLCTAGLLLSGETRPRRAEAVRRYAAVARRRRRPGDHAVLAWAARSFGPDGRDEHAPVRLPPGGLQPAAGVVQALREEVAVGARALAASLARRYRPHGAVCSEPGASPLQVAGEWPIPGPSRGKSQNPQDL